MSAKAMTARPAVLRWQVMTAVLVLVAAGLGSVGPAPWAAADAASMAGLHASAVGQADPGTAYVVNLDSDTVTPINTATNTAGPSIPVGSEPGAIAITPDGKTAYVANANAFTVTPITTATNTAGRRSRPERFTADRTISRSRRTARRLTSPTAPRIP